MKKNYGTPNGFQERKGQAGSLLAFLSGAGAAPYIAGAVQPGNLRAAGYKRQEEMLARQEAAQQAAFEKSQELERVFQEALLAKQAPAVSGNEALVAGGISLLGGLLGARPQYTQGAYNQFIGGREQQAEAENQKRLAAAKMAYESGMRGVEHQARMGSFGDARDKMMMERSFGAADQIEGTQAAMQKAAYQQWKDEQDMMDKNREFGIKRSGAVSSLLSQLDQATDRGHVHAIQQQLAALGSPMPENVLNAAARAAEQRGALPGLKFQSDQAYRQAQLGLSGQRLQLDWAKYGLDVQKTSQQMDISQRNLAMAEQKHAERVLTQPERQAAVDGVSMTLKPLLDAFNKAKMDPEGNAAAIQTELLKTLRRGASLLGANHPSIVKFTSALKAAGVSADALATLESTNPYEYVTRPFESALKGAAQKAPEGTPYVWGGQNLSKGIDCSGLVCEVYKNAGINLGDNTAAGYFSDKQFRATTRDALKPGDLIFYHTDKKNPGKVSHVGIYMGDGKVKHASSSKGTVTVPMTSLKYPVAGYRTYKNG